MLYSLSLGLPRCTDAGGSRLSARTCPLRPCWTACRPPWRCEVVGVHGLYRRELSGQTRVLHPWRLLHLGLPVTHAAHATTQSPGPQLTGPRSGERSCAPPRQSPPARRRRACRGWRRGPHEPAADKPAGQHAKREKPVRQHARLEYVVSTLPTFQLNTTAHLVVSRPHV